LGEREKKRERERGPAKTPKTENSNLHGFDLHRPSSKGTKSLLQVIKAIINQSRERERERESTPRRGGGVLEKKR